MKALSRYIFIFLIIIGGFFAFRANAFTNVSTSTSYGSYVTLGVGTSSQSAYIDTQGTNITATTGLFGLWVNFSGVSEPWGDPTHPINNALEFRNATGTIKFQSQALSCPYTSGTTYNCDYNTGIDGDYGVGSSGRTIYPTEWLNDNNFHYLIYRMPTSSYIKEQMTSTERLYLDLMPFYNSGQTIKVLTTANGEVAVNFEWNSTTTSQLPPVATSSTITKIDSFTYSTTTNIANVKGYINATSTTDYETLTFWQSSIYGNENYQVFNATESTPFDFNYNIILHQATSTGTTTSPIGTDYSLNVTITKWTSEYELITLASSTLNINSNNTINNINDVLDYPEYECSITSVIGCIKNALVWAFYPTQGAIQSYNQFTELLKTKAPMGYFYVIKDGLNGLNASSTPTFEVNIPSHIKTYFFDPIDIGLAGILWFYYLVWFYKRIKHITV